MSLNSSPSRDESCRNGLKATSFRSSARATSSPSGTTSRDFFRSLSVSCVPFGDLLGDASSDTSGDPFAEPDAAFPVILDNAPLEAVEVGARERDPGDVFPVLPLLALPVRLRPGLKSEVSWKLVVVAADDPQVEGGETAAVAATALPQVKAWADAGGFTTVGPNPWRILESPQRSDADDWEKSARKAQRVVREAHDVWRLLVATLRRPSLQRGHRVSERAVEGWKAHDGVDAGGKAGGSSSSRSHENSSLLQLLAQPAGNSGVFGGEANGGSCRSGGGSIAGAERASGGKAGSERGVLSAAAKAATAAVGAARGLARHKEARALGGGDDDPVEEDVRDDRSDSTEGVSSQDEFAAQDELATQDEFAAQDYNPAQDEYAGQVEYAGQDDYYVTLAGDEEEDEVEEGGREPEVTTQFERVGSEGSGESSSSGGGRHRPAPHHQSSPVRPAASPKALPLMGAAPRALVRGATWSAGTGSSATGDGGGAWAGLDSMFSSAPLIVRRSRSGLEGDGSEQHITVRTRSLGSQGGAAGSGRSRGGGSPPSPDSDAAALVGCYGVVIGRRPDRSVVQREGLGEEDVRERHEAGHGSRWSFTPSLVRSRTDPARFGAGQRRYSLDSGSKGKGYGRASSSGGYEQAQRGLPPGARSHSSAGPASPHQHAPALTRRWSAAAAHRISLKHLWSQSGRDALSSPSGAEGRRSSSQGSQSSRSAHAGGDTDAGQGGVAGEMQWQHQDHARPGSGTCVVRADARRRLGRRAGDEDEGTGIGALVPVSPEDDAVQTSGSGRRASGYYSYQGQRAAAEQAAFVRDMEAAAAAAAAQQTERQVLMDSDVAATQQSTYQRKTKIVCTIGPTSNTREMLWKLAETGMNVVRLNMSHGDHQSHRRVVDLVREYNKGQASQGAGNVLAIMLDTKGPEVRSGDLPQPIELERGESFTFTIRRGVGSHRTVSVNYDGFIDDVDVDDIILVDGGMMSFQVKSKSAEDVECEVVDGGELKSRRHLNVRGKSATLPSITDKDWEDIRFGVENKVDYYALSFVKDAQVVLQLKEYLKGQGADIGVIAKIESADSVPNLHAILEASDGAMVARGDLGAELPVEEVPLLQGEIIRVCRALGKPVIVATNMLESMINHPTPTRAEVSDIAIAVREGTDAIMLSGETAHGKFPLKAVRVMHTVAVRTEATMAVPNTPANLGRAFKRHTSEMFAFHATMMANTLGASVLVFTRSGFMAMLLSHYRPASITYAFTNDKRVQQHLALYHGVRALYMPFSADAEDTFNEALRILLKRGMVQPGDDVALVQSGRQPIWRSESTHHIQVRRVMPLN
ncbi:unnamed protein product [Closterium sp. NIES-64]|nr:unnamed protein product [Closterium sp. NIES-64]